PEGPLFLVLASASVTPCATPLRLPVVCTGHGHRPTLVCHAKLYYLRDLRGKAAKIKEKR
ncbi:50S ribosomal protein L19, partial [Nocardia cyriacigeorgica]|uniref:50S ribosomal protein L19 n=1 Tax=Nocardia cyriacigeorgica TaxID=135487 RepID=UPI0021146828